MTLLTISFRIVCISGITAAFQRVRSLTFIPGLTTVNGFGGHFQFLTIQALWLTWLTLVLSIISELIPTSKVLHEAKRKMLVLSMPLSVTVSSIYWPLIIFLPTLLLPPAASGAIDPDFFVGLPIDIELGLHLLPAFALLIEFFAFEARYSHVAAAKESRQLAAGFASFYACFVEYCALYNSGTFPYPFLTHSPLWGRILIYLGATGVALSSFKLLNSLHT